MKRIIVVFLFLGFLSSSVFAETVNVITFEYPPYILTSEKGAVDSIVSEVLKEAKYEHTRSVVPVKRTTYEFLNSKNPDDILVSASLYTASLENVSKIDLFNIGMVFLYNKKFNKDINPGNPESLKGKRLGTIQKSGTIEKFEKAGAIIEESTVESNLKKLEAGRIDMLNMADIGAYEAMKANKDFAVSKPYLTLTTQIVIKKENAKLYEDCKNAFNKIKKSGMYKNILEKYYGSGKIPD